jgi:predicted lipid-binding transport protein (Tim44 family)
MTKGDASRPFFVLHTECGVVADVHQLMQVFMQDTPMTHTHCLPARARRTLQRATVASGLALLAAVHTAVQADDKPVYKCPGNLYTDAMSPREAQDKGCKTLDGAPVTVIQSTTPRNPAASGGRPVGGERVGADDQKARDTDARRILEAELRQAEEALAALQKEYNAGQPERRGDERNFQKYQDRVNELKASITRKESDVASLKRELAKLGGGK